MRARQARNFTVILTSLLLIAVGFNNCGQRKSVNNRDPLLLASATLHGNAGSTGGNPALTTLRFGSYGAPVGTTNVTDGKPGNIDIAPMGLSFFAICASTVQFYPVDGTQPLELALNRDIVILADGTPISDFPVPTGSYKGVVIKIGDTCGTGRSFEFTNGAGTITSQDETTMAFGGNFKAGTKNIVLTLGITEIVAALAETTTEDAAKNSINLPSTVQPLEEPGEGTLGGVLGGGGIAVD